MTLAIGFAFCLDCESSQPLTKHGACSVCGSNAIAPRRRFSHCGGWYVPDELTRLSLGNIETVPDELVLPS